jgi:integrase
MGSKSTKTVKPLTEAELQQRFESINKSFKADGKKIQLVRANKSVFLQFTAPLRPGDKPSKPGRPTKQYKLGEGYTWSREGLERADENARKIERKLSLKEFTWEWYDREIAKKLVRVNDNASKLIAELQSDYKKHFFATHPYTTEIQIHRTNANWRINYWKYISRFNAQELLSGKEICRVIETTKSNTPSRYKVVSIIQNFLKFLQLFSQYEDSLNSYKLSTKHKQKDRYIPTDREIEEAFFAFKLNPSCVKKHLHTFPKKRWNFGIMATYGLRDHESWHIENLYEVVDFDGVLIPALNDPNNTTNLIVISANTKTGRRLAMPVSPEGKNWIEKFDLKNPKPLEVNLNVKTPERVYSNTLIRFFNAANLKFRPYDLRHAFNHRCEERGISTAVAALSLGHSEVMNAQYKRNRRVSRTINVLTQAIESQAVITAKLSLEQALTATEEIVGDDSTMETAYTLLAAIYDVSVESISERALVTSLP